MITREGRPQRIYIAAPTHVATPCHDFAHQVGILSGAKHRGLGGLDLGRRGRDLQTLDENDIDLHVRHTDDEACSVHVGPGRKECEKGRRGIGHFQYV